jgi:hypothetical protein
MTDATTPESTTDPGDVQAQLAMMKCEIDAPVLLWHDLPRLSWFPVMGGGRLS